MITVLSVEHATTQLVGEREREGRLSLCAHFQKACDATRANSISICFHWYSVFGISCSNLDGDRFWRLQEITLNPTSYYSRYKFIVIHPCILRIAAPRPLIAVHRKHDESDGYCLIKQNLFFSLYCKKLCVSSPSFLPRYFQRICLVALILLGGGGSHCMGWLHGPRVLPRGWTTCTHPSYT